MSVNTITKVVPDSLQVIVDEVRFLVERGRVSRQQPIYTLWEYIPAREWICLETELEKLEYLLRDRIGDLIGHEKWNDD